MKIKKMKSILEALSHQKSQNKLHVFLPKSSQKYRKNIKVKENAKFSQLANHNDWPRW
jgi:hypothetical protein